MFSTRRNPPRDSSRLAGQGAVLFAAILWSSGGLFIKLLAWHPMVISGTRSMVAGIFLLVVRLITPSARGVKSPLFPLWCGAFIYALTMLTFVLANKLTSSANAILLQYSAPVWAALLGWWLLGEKPRWEHWGALALVSGGLVLFFRGGLGGGAVMGNGLAVLSGILFGAYSVFLRMLKNGNPRDAMILSHFINALIGIPFLVLFPPILSTSSVLSVLFLGTVQIGLASLFFVDGVKRITALQAMLTAIAEPLLNPVWVFLVTGEKPTLSALAGGAIIISAVVASFAIGMRKTKKTTED